MYFEVITFMKEYILEKWLWKDEDFEHMCWHDCKIHAVAFDESNFKLLFDIDYIFKWVEPQEDKYYRFWISPATLVFDNVYDLNIELSSTLGTTIEVVRRINPNKPRNSDYIGKDTEWEWIIETINGQINFKSVGYTLYVRKKPIYNMAQEINFTERGGYSFFTSQVE